MGQGAERVSHFVILCVLDVFRSFTGSTIALAFATTAGFSCFSPCTSSPAAIAPICAVCCCKNIPLSLGCIHSCSSPFAGSLNNFIIVNYLARISALCFESAGHIIFSVIVKYKLLEARFRDHTGGVVESSPVILLYYFIYHYAVRKMFFRMFLRIFSRLTVDSTVLAFETTMAKWHIF